MFSFIGMVDMFAVAICLKRFRYAVTLSCLVYPMQPDFEYGVTGATFGSASNVGFCSTSAQTTQSLMCYIQKTLYALAGGEV